MSGKHHGHKQGQGQVLLQMLCPSKCSSLKGLRGVLPHTHAVHTQTFKVKHGLVTVASC